VKSDRVEALTVWSRGTRGKSGRAPLTTDDSLHMRRDRRPLAGQLDELRDLWCGWDPIGCVSSPNWPRDEYDSYLEPSLSLLQGGASIRQITEYLEWAAYRNMGVSLTAVPPATFAAHLVAWWKSRANGPKSAN